MYTVSCLLPDRETTALTTVEYQGESKYFKGRSDGRFETRATEQDLPWLNAALANLSATDVTVTRDALQ